MMSGVTLVAIAMGWAVRWAMGRAVGQVRAARQVMRHATMRAMGGGRNCNPMSIATENHKFLIMEKTNEKQWKKTNEKQWKKQMKKQRKNR